MADISDFLNKVTDLIDNDDFAGASALISDYAGSNPTIIDERFKAELSLISKAIEYKSDLKDWAYFRMMRLTYQYIEMQYVPQLKIAEDIGEYGSTLPDRDKVWCCWLQGLDNAPDIVRKCVRSLNRLGKEIVILTDDNIENYVDIPDHIYDKRNKGLISNTHFTDILRAELLSKRGGTWIDATVFCSDSTDIIKIMNRYPLFCYSFAMRDSISDSIMFDSWFLHCSHKSRIMDDTRELLYMYWQNEERLLHYFLFHLIFTISCRRHPDESGRIPIYSLEPCHILQKEMQRPFDDFRYESILKMNGIHKLTYKYDPFDIKGTMLEHVLEEADPA